MLYNRNVVLTTTPWPNKRWGYFECTFGIFWGKSSQLVQTCKCVYWWCPKHARQREGSCWPVWKVCLLSLHKCQGQRGHYISKLTRRRGETKRMVYWKGMLSSLWSLSSHCPNKSITAYSWYIPGLGTWNIVEDCMCVCVIWYHIKGKGRQTLAGKLLWICREKVCVLFSPCK